MDLKSWMPVIVEITKFTLDQLRGLVFSGRASAQDATCDMDKIKISSYDLSSADFPELARKINRSITTDSLKLLQNKYYRAKNIQRQIEIKEVAYSGLVDQASPQALQLQLDIQRLQEDQLLPLIKELNEDLGQIFS